LNFYGPGGILESIFWVMVSNEASNAFLAIFDPLTWWRGRRAKNIEKAGANNKLNQAAAHALYEGSDFVLD
jgi:hypothetical protein